MTTYAIRPTPYGEQVLMNKVIFEKNYVVPNYDREDPQAKNHIALRRGPLVLAQDSDFGYNVDNPISIKISDNGTVDAICNTDENFGKYVVKVDVPLLSGETLTLADYGSVGKSPDVNNKIAAWILTNNI